MPAARECEAEHAMVELDRSDPDQRRQRRRQGVEQQDDTRAQCPQRQDQTGYAGRDGNEHPFGQKLPDHAAAARAQRQTDGDLAIPLERARQHDIRHVGARGNKDQDECREHRRQDRQQFERQLVGRRVWLKFCSRVAGRVDLLGHPGHERRQRRLRALAGHVRPETHADLDPARFRYELRRGERRVGRERDPDVARKFIQPGEFRSEDAHDDERVAIQVELAAEDGRVAAEQCASRPDG